MKKFIIFLLLFQLAILSFLGSLQFAPAYAAHTSDAATSAVKEIARSGLK